MISIKLHGWMAKRYGKSFKFYVSTPAQAIGLLRANFKDFERSVVGYESGFKLLIEDSEISSEELLMVCRDKTVHIIPVIAGSNDPVSRIVVGAALIYASFQTGGLTSQIALSAGGSLVLGGVMQILSPLPKNPDFSSEKADNKPSYSFNGAINTTGQGNPVPLLYGELLVGSQVASFGVSTRQV